MNEFLKKKVSHIASLALKGARDRKQWYEYSVVQNSNYKKAHLGRNIQALQQTLSTQQLAEWFQVGGGFSFGSEDLSFESIFTFILTAYHWIKSLLQQGFLYMY